MAHEQPVGQRRGSGLTLVAGQAVHPRDRLPHLRRQPRARHAVPGREDAREKGRPIGDSADEAVVQQVDLRATGGEQACRFTVVERLEFDPDADAAELRFHQATFPEKTCVTGPIQPHYGLEAAPVHQRSRPGESRPERIEMPVAEVARHRRQELVGRNRLPDRGDGRAVDSECDGPAHSRIGERPAAGV